MDRQIVLLEDLIDVFREELGHVLEDGLILRKYFSKRSRSPLQDDFERGYFTAWLEYISVLKSQDDSIT